MAKKRASKGNKRREEACEVLVVSEAAKSSEINKEAERLQFNPQDPNSQNLLKMFFDLSPCLMGILELQDNGIKIIFLNDAALALLKSPMHAYEGIFFTDTKIPRHLVDLWTIQMKKCIETQAPVSFEYGRILENNYQYFRITMASLGQESSANWRFSYVCQDYTDLKKSEEAHLKIEERFLLAEEFGQLGTWDLDVENNKLEWSDSLRKIYGVDPDVPAGIDAFARIVHPEDRDALFQGIQKAMEHGSIHNAEFRIFLQSGQMRWIEGRGKAVLDASGKCTRMVGISLDITDRKQTEAILEKQSAKLINLSKMSALGEMAGGIAHEINNPLTILCGSAALLKMEMGKPQPNLAKMSKITIDVTDTCRRIEKIIEGLRFFARDGSLDEMQKVPVNEVIEDTLGFCRERFKKHGIDLVFKPDANSPEIVCQPVQISQVLLNLLNNAHDAVEDAEVKRILLTSKTFKNKVEITVKDSGPGIPNKLKTKVFKPFFTTKEVKKGTGLGLSIAKGIVEAHTGTIDHHRHDEMTCFIITLPLTSPNSSGTAGDK